MADQAPPGFSVPDQSNFGGAFMSSVPGSRAQDQQQQQINPLGMMGGLGGLDPAQLSQALQNASNLSWSQLMGQIYNLPAGQIPPAGTLTMAGQLQQSNLTGLIPTGMPGAGGLNAAQQALTGYVRDQNGNLVPTTAQSGLTLQGINDILNANNNPANAFTYMSKLKGINNLGPAANFLRGGIFGATGTPLDILAQQPTISNSQAMAQAMAGILNPTGAAGNGNPNPMMDNSMLSALYGSSPNSKALYDPNNPTGGLSQNDLVAHAMGLLYNSKQANPQQPNTGGTPTGWGSSLQAYSKMAPTLQGAFTNLVSAGGGEQPNDFIAGMQAANPEFSASASGKLGSVGNF